MKKMNKKGFTLVELLAVIAILAILILLVTPNILKMFNEGKESIFVQQAQRVLEASNTKFMSVSLKSPGAYIFTNLKNATGDNVENLNLTNDSVTYCVKMDNEGKVTYIHVSSDTYSIKKADDNGVKVDDISDVLKADDELSGKKKGAYALLEDAVKDGEGANVVKTATSGVCE